MIVVVRARPVVVVMGPPVRVGVLEPPVAVAMACEEQVRLAAHCRNRDGTARRAPCGLADPGAG
jgi:hypothetical protein